MPHAHNVIAEGKPSGGLLIAADYPATGRTVAGFTDLLERMACSDTVWETAPAPVGAENGMTGSDHLDRWTADTAASDLEVRAVMGFCVGAVYAAALADRVAAAQGTPVPLIVFDPERPDPDLLLRHYEGVVDGLGKMLTPAELDAARAAGREARRSHPEMPGLAAALRELFAEHGAPALRRSGLNPQRSDELVNTFSSFLGYLVAASELDPLPAWSRATAVSSATPHSGLNPLPEDRRASMVARELRHDLPHTELLRDPRVARDVTSLLEGEPVR